MYPYIVNLQAQGELNIVSALKFCLNLFENILASWEVNFVSATMFPEVGKQRNKVSAKIFPSLPKA